MFDALFRFFFDLSPLVFSQGEFRFAPTTGSYVAAVVAGVAAGLTVLAYRAGRGRTRDRIALATIRVALLALILICLFRPLLVVKAAVPQQNFLGVLLDDSRSMQIADQRRPAARRVRARSVRRAGSRAAQGAVGSLYRPHLPLLVGALARRRKKICRSADRRPASAPRCRACARSWPACRSRVS